MGLGLEPGQVAALETRTEGWAAGLQLAALSARGRHRRSTGRRIGLRRGVHGKPPVRPGLPASRRCCSSQPEDVRAFLLDTSVLERADRAAVRRAHRAQPTGNRCSRPSSGPTCSSSRSTTSGGGTATTICSPTRCAPGSLAEHLGPGSRSCTARPARWYADHGSLADAIRHALAGGDAETAADLVELALPEPAQRRQDRDAREWLQALPDEVVRRRAAARHRRCAWTRLSEGDLDGVEARLDDAERRSLDAACAR